MEDFFHLGRLIALILYGGACTYLGSQFTKPKEDRHWHRLRKKKPRIDDYTSQD